MRNSNVFPHYLLILNKERCQKHWRSTRTEHIFRSWEVLRVQSLIKLGYRLGNTPGNRIPASSTGPRELRTKITLWKNGFCVDSGPLRDYNDPAQSSFLSAIRAGVVPKELQVGPGVKDVNVELIDKRGEDFKEPPQVLKPFSGSGYSLSQNSVQQSSRYIYYHIDRVIKVVFPVHNPIMMCQ